VPIPVFNFQVNFLLREVKSKQHKKRTSKLKNEKEIPQALKIFLLKKTKTKTKQNKKVSN